MKVGSQQPGQARDESRSARTVGIFMAGSCAVLWGFLAIVMKVVADQVDPFTIVWFRFSFAFGVLLLLFAARRPESLRILLRPPLLGLVAALALTVNYLGFLKGLALTTPSFAQVLIQSAPLMLALVGVVFFKERISRFQLAGALLAVAGFALFYHDQYEVEVVERANLQTGILVLSGAALAWTLFAALQKLIVARGTSPQGLNLLVYFVPAALMAPLASFGTLGAMSPALWGLMIFLGANTLLAYGALGEALARLPAFQVSLILTCNPLITLGLLALLHQTPWLWVPDDEVGPMGYAAALVVVAGIAGVLKRPPSEKA